MSLLSTQPYKGTRDFYPDQMRSREWMFSSLQKSAQKFGYQKYDAPLLEPLDIYLAKTSEEIVSRQIYSFNDRGERPVAIRPEMTPTVSRMIAARSRELSKPMRWFSLPNLWRYERPGKGRLREHWQLNCDLFAAQDEFAADVEILCLAAQILLDFGANKNDFQIFLSHREILNAVFKNILGLDAEKWAAVARVMDKKEKVLYQDYRQMLTDESLTSQQIEQLDAYLEQKENFLLQHNEQLGEHGGNYLLKMLASLRAIGYGDFVQYSPAVVRGFDYYTGMVFEIFDTDSENRRSLFGGGRYNNLVSYFTKDEINAVGFGLGDVTLENFLRTHNLYKTFPSATQIFVAWFAQDTLQQKALRFAALLREQGFCVETSLSTTKLGQQLKTADTRKIPWVLIYGADEAQNNVITVKNLFTGEQRQIPENELLSFFAKVL